MSNGGDKDEYRAKIGIVVKYFWPIYIFKKKENILDGLFETGVYSIFLLLPWYYNYSGQVQPVDICILLTAFIFLIQYSSYLNQLLYSRPYFIVLILLGYSTFRYAFAGIFTLHQDLLYDVAANFYYIVLTSLFTLIFIYFHQSKTKAQFYTVILNCLILNTLLPLITMIIYGPGYGHNKLLLGDMNTGRAILTFNNANQLGFSALINLSIFFYITLYVGALKITPIKKIASLFLININLIFIIYSASRASAPALILYILVYPLIFKNFQLRWIKKPLILSLTSSFLIIFASFMSIKLIHYMFMHRVQFLPVSDISFFNDIYMRGIEGIQHNFTDIYIFLFGYGSLISPWRELEFHNNFLSIFNQVGILGLFLYSCFIFDILFNLIKRGILYVMPFICYLFYSDVHYAFRTRMNWLYFGVLIFLLFSTTTKNRSFKNFFVKR